MKNSPGRFAVVGDPVAHSLSPLIHNAWMAEAGLDAHYERIHLQSSDAAADLRAMARAYDGLNVTLPHKVAALAAAAKSSPEAHSVGAANTLVAEDGGWMAHNTDIAGFDGAMQTACGQDIRDRHVLLIGAGGAARAAVVSLRRAGVTLTIANRSEAKAAALAAELAPAARVTGLDAIEHMSESVDLVVNSASLGHAGELLPQLAPGRGRPFLDLSYGKAAAPTLAAATQAGWVAHDGLVMLVAQAAGAFRLWFGIDPDQSSALAACRTVVANRT